MAELLIIGGIISVMTALIGSFIVLKIQQGYWQKTQLQQRAWQHAQEGHQSSWEVRHEKRLSELDRRLSSQVQQVQGEWKTWKEQDAERAQALAQQQENASQLVTIEREIARLPRVEDTPVIVNTSGQQQHTLDSWRPPLLQGANLSNRDLSHRYLGRADLREARLVGTNFFMSDLSTACLAGADLSGADLSGADLSGADLRNAILTGANLQVADLHNAILLGANLRGARNLTTQQVYSAIYDGTTSLDPAVDITMPVLPRVRPVAAPAVAEPAPSTAETPLPLEPEPVTLPGEAEFTPDALTDTTLSPHPEMDSDQELETDEELTAYTSGPSLPISSQEDGMKLPIETESDDSSLALNEETQADSEAIEQDTEGATAAPTGSESGIADAFSEPMPRRRNGHKKHSKTTLTVIKMNKTA